MPIHFPVPLASGTLSVPVSSMVITYSKSDYLIGSTKENRSWMHFFKYYRNCKYQPGLDLAVFPPHPL